MTLAADGPMSPLASRVLDHVGRWTREPYHPAVLEAGSELLRQTGLDQAILSIAADVRSAHGAAAYSHYRGYLLDAACHHEGSLVHDGEIRTVRSQLFLIAVDGQTSLIDNPAVLGEVAEDVLTSLECEGTGSEFLTILPGAFTIAGLAAVSPETIRRLVMADREAFSHDLGPVLEWGLRTGTDDPAWQRSHPAAAYGERALIGISHRIIDEGGTGAVERLLDPAAAQAWHTAMNATTESGFLRLAATIGWTDTLAHLAIQRLSAGFEVEARLTGQPIADGLFHFAARPDGVIVGWLEGHGHCHGPVLVPGDAVGCNEAAFESGIGAFAEFFMRYATAADLPGIQTMTGQRGH